MAISDAPKPDDIVAAARLLEGVVHHTPLLASRLLSAIAGCTLLHKAEHLQRTGSFKIRGAYTMLAGLGDSQRDAGVVAASAGNHAQGVAWAASHLGIAATVVMPAYASLPKIEATRGYGAQVVLSGETFDEALGHARALARERGSVFVHAFDDPQVVAGQGTAGLEIVADCGGCDQVVVPVGGGGLAAGVAMAVKASLPGTRVVGVRASATPATIADGAAVAEMGSLTSALLGELLDDLVEVQEDAISEAILLYLERAKQVVEGAGALPLAAMLSGAVAPAPTTVLLVSGGNIDPGLLSRVIGHGLQSAGRYLLVRLRLRDRPGQLHAVVSLLAELGVNVVSVVHHRVGLVLPVDEVEVELTLETRDAGHTAEVKGALREAGYPPA